MSARVRQIRWFNLPVWAARTAGASLLTYQSPKRPPSWRRLSASLNPRLNDAVFVVGAPRSGTTFLGRCLAELPELTYHFEPVATKAAARYVYEGSWDAARAARFYRRVYRWLARIHFDGDLRFAEKTPRNAFLVEFLAAAFPDARFVHIRRDGRDAALSLSKRPWLQAAEAESGRVEPGGYRYGPYPRFWVEPERRAEFESTSDLRRCAWSWRTHTEAALRSLAALPPGRAHELTYERLVTDPRPEAERLLDFLAIEEPASRQRFLAAASQAHADSVGGWRRMAPHDLEEVLAEAGELLARLGYLED